MKSSLFSKVMTLATAMLLAAGAFAAGAVHKATLQVNDPVQVNGKQLAAGEYTLTWDGDGPNVNLHISRGSKEVATAPATVVQLDQKASQDATEVKTGAAGSRQLTAIRFEGKKYQLDIAGAASQAQSKSGDSMK